MGSERRSPARSALAVLGAVLLLGLAGCGSTELSDKQLRAQATRVCLVANRLTGAIATPSGPAGGAAFLRAGLVALEPEYRQLQALHPPKDLAQVYEISLTAFSQKVAAIKSTVHHLARGGDPVILMKTLEQQLRPLESSEDGAWQTLQVPACLNR